METKLISIILPIYNECRNVPLMYKALKLELLKLPKNYKHEIVMVNDGSTDGSWDIIQNLVCQDATVVGLNFSRNFGYQAALTAGYKYCKGDAIVTMDSDLQHPPQVVGPMIDQWHKGAKIVYARRIDRQDGFLKKITAYFYHLILDGISEVRVPKGVSDFRLLDKQVVGEINTYNERSRYLRGIIAWTGFDHAFVDFHQPPRKHAETKYTWKTLSKIAFDGIVNFSIIPLKLAAYFGCFVIATGCIMLGIITVDALFFQGHYPLFKWLVTILYIFVGVLFILLWVLGEYIGRMYEELKGRPLFVLKESVGAQHQTRSVQKYEFNELQADRPKKSTRRTYKDGNAAH